MKSLIGLLIKKIKNLDTTQKEKAQMKKHAQKSALLIIEQANIQALDILSKANIDKQALDLYQRESLKKVSEEITNQYKQALNEVKNDRINIFKQNMQQEILTELNAYKKRKLLEIDDAVYKIASAAAKEVLRKTLSFDQHEELIIKALEDAKHDGLFS